MNVLDKLKTMLGIDVEDALLDDKLNIILENSQSMLLSFLPEDINQVPDELAYIVLELAIIRFNRVGNEGMKAYSQEGESITYGTGEEDIEPFMPAINAYLAAKGDEATKGKVRFL